MAADLEAAAEAKQEKKNNRKERCGGNRGGHLHERLRDARQAMGFEPMATPTGTVQSAPRISAVLTRRKVSAALSRSSS